MKVLLSLLIVTVVCHEGEYDHDHGPALAIVTNDEGLVESIDWRRAGVVHEPINQQSCGSCWSFATTGLLEAKYAQLTGELVKFSEGYFVDCQYPYSGCAGGHASDGLAKLEETQYLPNAETYPWTGAWSGQCNDNETDYKSESNALKDVWITYHSHIHASERNLMQALQGGPVPVHYYISNDMGSYRPGKKEEELVKRDDDYEFDDSDIFEDKNCGRDVIAHSSLLVGYTDKAWIIKQSWGANWGDHGYVYLARTDVAVQCNFLKHAVNVDMILKREIEYKNVPGYYNFRDGERRCESLNKPHKSGWTLAEIPTRMHWRQLLEVVQTKYGKASKKSTKKRNLDNFWIGLNLKSRNNLIYWEDEFTELAFTNFASRVGSYSTIAMSRLNGQWSSSNEKTEMRILCSRYVTCPRLRLRDVPNAESIVFGADNAILAEKKGQLYDSAVETATATITCKEGFVMHGDAKAVCHGGIWALPECEDHAEEMTL